MISRDDADRALIGLTAAYERIATAIYAVDVHPALGWLRGGLSVGATQSRWLALSPEIDLLWAHFAALGECLEQARAKRAGHRPGDPEWTQLAQLLAEPVIGLGADGMPMDGAGMAVSGQAGTVTSRISVGDLAQNLEKRCASVATHLSDVDAARSALVARVGAVATVVDAVASLADELGEASEVESLRESLAEGQRRDLGDPVEAAPGGRLTAAAEARWVALAGQAQLARDRLDALTRLRAEYPGRLAALRKLIDAVGAEELAAAEAYRRAAEKIADPGLPEPPAAMSVLRARLGELDQRGQGKQWRRLADDLAVSTESAQRARARAIELTQLAQGLLARRDELRGRLAAYRAKAAARGLAEHDQLTVQHGLARSLLYTAPCDLRASTRAVYAYQQILASVLGGERSDVDG